MRFGIPVIACRSGGVPEVVADGVVGLLIEPGSVTELSKSMGKLIENPELRKQMGRAASHHVEKYFTAEKMALNSYRALSEIRNDWSGTI